VMVALVGLPIADVDALQRQLAAGAIGRVLPMTVVRWDRCLTLVVTPRESPPRSR
jgi:hypothetical protein